MYTKEFGENMKYFLALLTLAFAVAAYGQEEFGTSLDELTFDQLFDTDSTTTDSLALNEMFDMDSSANDTIAFDDFFSPDTSAMTIDAQPEDGVEDLLSEEGTDWKAVTGTALIGYTAGLDFNYPIYRHGGLGKTYNVSHLAIGLAISSPFGIQAGPFEIGFGLQVGNFSFSNSGNTRELSGLYILATANTAIYETSDATVSTQIGTGYFGESLGITMGITFDYAVPGKPIVLRPYWRVNGTLDSGGAATGDHTASYSWVNMGAMVSYDISTLF